MRQFKLIDDEYYNELDKYGEQFKSVDRKDPQSLKKWFLDHPYLTIHDHALIAGVGRLTIRRWRARAGMPKMRGGKVKCNSMPKITIKTAPENWRTYEWLSEQYQRHSIPEIAAMVNRSYFLVHRMMKRLGVMRRTPKEGCKPNHQCCDEGWLRHYYEELGYSMLRCAKLAGVSRYCIESWLLRFGIRIRAACEQSAAYNFNTKLTNSLCRKSG